MKIVMFRIRNNIFNPILSLIFWILIALFFITLSLVKTDIFPHYFFLDSHNLIKHIKITNFLVHGDSFSSTSYIYKSLGITYNSTLLSIISVILILYIMFIAIKRTKIKTIGLSNISIFLFINLLSTIYMTVLSKEFIVFLFCSILIFSNDNNKKIYFLIWFLFGLIYAYWFRSYWYILLPTIIYISISYKLSKNLKHLFFFCILYLFLISSAFPIVLGIPVDYYRSIVNNLRISSGTEYAKTMILPFIPGSSIPISFTNIALTWISIVFPIPLFLLLSPYYILLFIFISKLFINVITSIKSNIKKPFNKTSMFSCVIISFTLIQSIFEPDYGSVLKHLSPFYPLIFYIILSEKTNIKP